MVTQSKNLGENLVEQLSSRRGGASRNRNSIKGGLKPKPTSEDFQNDSESNIGMTTLKPPNDSTK